MLSGRSLKEIGVREDRVDCKPYSKFKLSTVHPEISEEKVENWNGTSLQSTLSYGHPELIPAFFLLPLIDAL